VRDLGWATRSMRKPMEDSQIGKYKAPSLLMQEGTDRVLLEPIARLAPRTEGVVDPLPDARLRRHREPLLRGRPLEPALPVSGTAAANTRAAPAKPLSQGNLQEVLAEMKQHAA